ncbi:pleckstrin homology domain-containing family M member 2 [Schistocerca gregaria]|uniref:pleckstrin homology domain-containing family M member 2 n=1 Tax=Schistocerca gregaria TaxID=7010 RepID=UPI00211DEFEC|nr:pleckstrin homology domain-containing family M member 2 [Schistocerca gregaria]
MELHDDNSAVKDRILEDIRKAIKLLHQQEVQQLKRDAASRAPCPASAALVSHLDAGLRHGLREQRPGYWPLVADVSHSETRRTLAGISSPSARGKAWVQLAVSEGSLRSHLQCALSDREALARHYGDRALLRDHARSQLLLHLVGVADAVAGGLLRQQALELRKPAEEESGKGTPGAGATGPDPLMMASVTSSLASPVDSGVALLDSDSEATTANGEPDDGSSLREVEAAFHDMEGTTPTPSLACPPPAAVVESCGSPAAETPVGSEGSCDAFVYPNSDPANVQDAVERQVLNEIARRFKESNSPRRKVDSSTKAGTNQPADTNKMSEPIITMCNEKKYEMEEKSDLVNKEASVMGDSEAKNNEKNRIYHSPDNKELEAAVGDTDGIVFRRHRRRRKANGDPATPKRVSFHGDVGVGGATATHAQGQQFSASFMPAHPVVKKDVVPGRYSWCAEGDAPFVERRDGGAGGTCSDVLLASSTSSVATTDTTGTEGAKDAEVRASTDSLEVSEERGIPEGREDPPRPAGTDRGSYRPSGSSVASCGALTAGADDSAIAAAAAAAGSRGGCFVLSASLAKFASMASSIDYWSSDEADGDESALTDKRQSMLSVASSAPSLKARISQRRLTALSQKPSKAPLLQRFMRSLAGSAPRRPLPQWRRGLPVAAPTSPFPRLPCPVPTPPICATDSPERAVALAAADATFAAEMRQLAAQKISAAAAEADCGPPGDVELDREIAQKAFSATVFCRPTETLYKVYKVSSSYWSPDGAGPRPLLLLLTDWGVYVCGLRANLTYCAVLALAYRDLHTVIAGPRLQTLILVPDPVTHPLPPLALATPDGDCARSLLCHLDVAARRSSASQKVPGGPRARLLLPVRGGPTAPAVAEVSADDMARLKAQLDVEEMVHYALVRVQDEQLSPPSTPLGPQRQGYLMARASEDEPWRPAFFILKAGVLYQFADQAQRLPLSALLLGGGHCLGARRIAVAHARPHSFELCTAADGDGSGAAVEGRDRRVLQMAAADEYEASEWLQALVQAASGLYEVERAETVPCSVVLTPTSVLTCREHWWPRWVGVGSPGGGAEGRHGRAETLARAPLADITSVTVATDSDSWCILEFSCREVHATSGDWVLYFASPREMIAFREALRTLWPSVSKREFPLRGRLEEGLHRRCVETALQLAAAWDQLLPLG